MNRLPEQVAWISGGASGIGAAIAETFAAEGAKVAVMDIDVEGGRQVVERITDSGGEAVFIECDVGVEDQVRASIDQTVARFGGLRIIINNAGIVQIVQLHESTETQWDNLMGVNVKSIFFSLKHGLKHLRRHNRSYMVNLGSISSFVGQSGTPAYTTSKHAVLGLTRSIAADYAADGLRCNCVCPGITDTPLLRHHMPSDEAISERLHRVPMGVALTPRDIARSALFFSCEDSAGVTGTSLVVDCGYLTAAEWESGETKFNR